jgi:hypothetical protein
MLNLSNEKFIKRLDARIAQVEGNIRELNKTLKDLQSLRMDTSVTVKRLLLASEHLDILVKSRKVMQDIITTSNFIASLDRPVGTHGRNALVA